MRRCLTEWVYDTKRVGINMSFNTALAVVFGRAGEAGEYV